MSRVAASSCWTRGVKIESSLWDNQKRRRTWTLTVRSALLTPRVPPKAHVLGLREDCVEIVDHVVKRDSFLHRKAGSRDSCTVTISRSPERGIEERTLLVVRVSDELAVCSTVSTMTSPGSTLNSTLVPYVVVEMTPPSAWVEIEPGLCMARPYIANCCWRSMRVMPASATT